MPRAPIIALVIFTLLAVACSSGAATTPSPIPEATQTIDPDLPTAQELKQSSRELFSAFFTAIEDQDADVLHGLLTADIRERCTPEQVQQSLGPEDEFFPELEVKAVFLDLEDPNTALVQVSLLEEPEAGLAGMAASVATIFPFPMVQEDGQWRLSFPFFPKGEDCPFDDGSSQEESATVTPAPPWLASIPHPVFLGLVPPPGVDAIVSSSGGGGGEYNASVLLGTDMTLAVLLEYYRAQVLQPDWKVQQETMDEDLAALTWTFRDGEGFQWFGVLLVASAEEGLRWVRLWSGSAAEGPMRAVAAEPPQPPVPAPTESD